jgi:conjugative transfer signal peptidase TraF
MFKLHLTRKYPFVILAFLFSTFFIIKFLGVIINITPSMPTGIYIKTSGEIKRGDIVAACLSDPYKTIGLKQLYIEKGVKCDGADPVIKEVVALPGDNVVLKNNRIIVNNINLFFITARKDSAGRILDIYPRGEYLDTKGYWLIGTNSQHSWDSRYWGSIDKAQIMSKLQPVITSRNFVRR